MTDPPIRVDAVALRLFTHVVAHFEEQGWPLPKRQYVSFGAQHEMAVDDEHLLVSLVQVDPGPANQSDKAGDLPSVGIGSLVPPRAVLMVRLMRCVPTVDQRGKPPTAAALHEAGLRLLLDPGRLLSAIDSWNKTEHPKTVTWGQVEAQGPEGGISGHLASVTISPIQ